MPRTRATVAPPPALVDCDRLWTINDVSDFLGVPVATLYGWRHRGDGPPARRLGKHLRYLPADVHAWYLAQAS